MSESSSSGRGKAFFGWEHYSGARLTGLASWLSEEGEFKDF